ncbi:DUF512 domain-containing protein [Christensenellaceae bacterium OttesenSCG-928-M15]|nr:DUF512 domain-containing protein [Christensenellaceae bacterium OttesenSCG-928-M15]
MHRVTGVDEHSIAEEIGVEIGDMLVSINGTSVHDVVDYEYLCATEYLEVAFQSADGETYIAEIEKDVEEHLGLTFESSLMSPLRSCKNKCVFCFIDQMPKGGRETLQFKDDDWRLSFIMGNYISLTNVDDAEFQRMIDRRVSPLYVSVHATDPDVRIRMMNNKTAGNIMERLITLKTAGLKFHCQIVCCPELNDGEILEKTLQDLYTLYPAALSVAVVPVGITKYRKGLYPLRMLTVEEAKKSLHIIRNFAAKAKAETGDEFVYASDEFVLQAEEGLPLYEEYGDFPQIENGVGLLRLFEHDFLEALREQTPLEHEFVFDAAGGIMAHGFFIELFKALEIYHIRPSLHYIVNDFFGHDVTVGGLITGQDLINQLCGKLRSNILFLPHNMLREQEDVFLDGVTVNEAENSLGAEIIPVRGEGAQWVKVLFGLANSRNGGKRE